MPICEYVEENFGASELIGVNPEDRAQTRMWCRRIDLGITETLSNGYRYSNGSEFFSGRIPLYPDAAPHLKQMAQDKLSWLDSQMSGQSFICGERFSLADILLFVFLEFGVFVKQPLNENNKNILNWYQRVNERQSAQA